MDVKIVSSKSIWKKPDGSGELFEVDIEFNNKIVKVKTWSKSIADSLGKSLDVESYEGKEFKGKKDKFIKQIKKGGQFSPGRQELDKRLTSLICAKDIVIAEMPFKNNGVFKTAEMLNIADELFKWLNR